MVGVGGREACGFGPDEGPGHQPFLAPEFLISINIYFLPPFQAPSVEELQGGWAGPVSKNKQVETDRQTDLMGCMRVRQRAAFA